MHIPLYLKTYHSLLSSMIDIPSLISYAKKHQWTSLVITDTTLYGAMEFYLACQKNNIKPIIGLEIQIDKSPILVYAMHYEGYVNLMHLATLSSKRALMQSDLVSFSSGLLCIVPYQSTSLYSDLKQYYQCIYQGYETKEQRATLNDENLLFLKEVLYLDFKDKAFYPYLKAIGQGIKVEDIESSQSYLIASEEELVFIDQQDQTNYEMVLSLCQLEIPFQKNLLPNYDCPIGYDSYSYLKKLCVDGLRALFGKEAKQKYVERLKHELSIIRQMGFCDYFLIVWDYVKYAKDHGMIVPGRGSAVGSLVAYVLGITTIDPLQYDLLFERFLNPERVSMPDIDIDFEYDRREEVINYCISKYGIKKVAPIITFGTLGAKQAIRDVARTMDLDLVIVDQLCKKLDSRLSLINNYQQNPSLKEYILEDEQLKLLYRIASRLEGFPRHTSIHASGVVMASMDLDNVIPLVKNQEGFYLTGYSMEYLEQLGLLKMDFLALRNLTLITDVLEDINQDLQLELTYDTIPEHDPKAIALFTNVDTVGIFQFESSGMMNFLRKFKPSNFEEIVAAIALFRPGPMENIDTYINRKRGKEAIEYLHPDLIPILKSTYGIMIYQEQIMQVANVMAGYSLSEADVLRQAMSKKKEDVLKKEREKFIAGCIKKGCSSEVATKLYEQVLKFASYGFNRAHSVVYSMIAYKMAYLKAHYPVFFMKRLLSMVIGSTSKTKEYIYLCKLYQIPLLKPDVNDSGSDYKIEQGAIRYPLTNIKHVGTSAVKQILIEREKGMFTDIFNFVSRLYGNSVNRKTLESLIDAGCFASFGINKQTLQEHLDAIINYGELGALFHDDDTLKPVLTPLLEYDTKTTMEREYELFGFYLSNHPVTEYRIQYQISTDLTHLDDYFDQTIIIILYLDRIKTITTKKDETMAFLQMSDEINTIDITMFPKLYQHYHQLEAGMVLKVTGRVEKRYDKMQIIASGVDILA